MTSPPEDPPPDADQELQELLVQCLDQIAESGLAAAEPILQANGALAPQLRERLRKLQTAGLLPIAEATTAKIPERLGDFRLLQRLGAGGMGVVYLAVQESLGREVALKLVRPEQLFFPGARERFHREVAAVARLKDPGIVGIHVVGEDAGIPFFAMDRIAGETLAELLRRLEGRRVEDLSGEDLWRALLQSRTGDPASAPAMPPLFQGSWVTVCVRILEQMTRAVAHAHGNGVLHRDLKSSNAMLQFDGRVVLLDFGLAQARGASRLTRTGAQVGTLHTMAPEQLRGEIDLIDERADVYGLGVLFYEMLTLRVPFPGDSYDTVAKRILDANPEAPTRANPGVPGDHETVCLTAMDPVLARRYPSANALLRDLGNLLGHRPIEARRPSTLVRLHRFSQRHRALTTAFVITMLAMIATPIVIAVRERGLNASLTREMGRARANLEASVAALNRIVQEAVDESLDEVPDLRAFNEHLLQETGACLDALIDSNPEEPRARLTLAETLSQASTMRWSFLDFARTATLLKKAIDLLADDAAATRAVDAERFDFALLDARLALALLQQRDKPRADYAAELRTILAEVSAHGPIEGCSCRLRARFAAGLERLGSLGSVVPFAEGRRLLEQSLALREGVVAEQGDVTALLEVGGGHRQLAALFAGKEDAALRALHLRGQRDVLAQAAARSPNNDAERLALANALRVYSSMHGNDLPAEESLTMLRQAAALFQEVAARRPSRTGAREELSSVQLAIGSLMMRMGRTAEAIDALAAVDETILPLLATWPSSSAGWQRLLDAQMLRIDGLAGLIADGTDPAQVVAWSEQRMALLAALLVHARSAQKISPMPVVMQSVAQALGLQATDLIRQARLDAAMPLIDEGRRLFEAARELGIKQRTFLGQPLRLRFAEVAMALARADRQAALQVLQSLARELPKDLYVRLPRLRELRDEPGFAELLRSVNAK